MRSVEIVSTKEEGGVRNKPAFIFVKTDEGPRYETLARVLSDDEMRDQVIERASKEFDQWANRYEEYEEFLGVFKAFDKTRKILGQKHEAIAN